MFARPGLGVDGIQILFAVRTEARDLRDSGHGFGIAVGAYKGNSEEMRSPPVFRVLSGTQATRPLSGSPPETARHRVRRDMLR